MNKVDEWTVRMGDEGPLHNKSRKHTCIHAVTRVQNIFGDAIRLGLDYPTDKMLEDMVRDAEWNALWNPREIAEQHDQDMHEMRRIWNQALGANVVEESELIAERESRFKTELACEQWIRQCELLQETLSGVKTLLRELLPLMPDWSMRDLKVRVERVLRTTLLGSEQLPRKEDE